jgi:hypothetical protein
MMKEIADSLGGLDILVNNSGIIRDRTIKKLSAEEFEAVVRVNLTGTFNVTQKAAVVLRQGGRVVNLSSVSGQMGLFGQANYSSSKAAIIALTKVSAREFARQQITVNAIAPGFIDIGMSKGMPDDVTENFKKQIPLGRLGEASEIVALPCLTDGKLYHRSCLERERRLLHGLMVALSRRDSGDCKPPLLGRFATEPSQTWAFQVPLSGIISSLGKEPERLFSLVESAF